MGIVYDMPAALNTLFHHCGKKGWAPVEYALSAPALTALKADRVALYNLVPGPEGELWWNGVPVLKMTELNVKRRVQAENDLTDFQVTLLCDSASGREKLFWGNGVFEP